jgi:16S rRNA (uracil1498-N3)-methyltransferase
MKYLYRADSKNLHIKLEGEDFKYIAKARRHKIGDIIWTRNLKDRYIYKYRIENITKKTATLTLVEQKELTSRVQKELNIGWCIIEPKAIEKSLASLNEIGVNSITFIYCKRSQRNFKLDFKRLEKILINSSQQCGRDNIIDLNIVDKLEDFIKLYPDAKLLNFSKNPIKSDIKNIIVGCEGGFSSEEIALFRQEDIVGFSTPLILKSQTAICSLASKILL